VIVNVLDVRIVVVLERKNVDVGVGAVEIR